MADPAHVETEKMLAKLERKIGREYDSAAAHVKKRLDAHLRQYEEQDKKQKALVEQGLLSQSDYEKWRLGKMATGRRWEQLKNVLAQDSADKLLIARKLIGEHMKDVYALNYNFAEYEIESGIKANLSFTLYDHATVERLLRDNPDILPQPGKKVLQDIAAGKAKKWSKRQLQSIATQAILTGNSIPKIAEMITERFGDMEKYQAIRAARTMTTTAQNAGRMDSYKSAQELGISMKKTWVAALDSRTRHAHRQLDGQMQPVNKPFNVDGEEIMYPGDLSAPGYLVYNCRCRVIAAVEGMSLESGIAGIERASKLGDMSYEEWKHEHERIRASVVKLPKFSSTMSREDYLSWQKENSTEAKIRKEQEQRFKEKYGYTFEEAGRLWKDDVFIDEEDEWLSALPDKIQHSGLLADCDQVKFGYGHCGYIQDSDGSKAINAYLRKGEIIDRSYSKQQIQKTVDAMERLIDYSVLDRDMTVDRCAGIDALQHMGINVGVTGKSYRIGHAFCTDGVDLEGVAKGINDNLIGAILTDEGFMSASVNADSNVFGGSDVTFTILAEKGRHAFITDNTTESEIIFAHGTKQELLGARVVEREATGYDGKKVKRQTIEILLKIID